jgi:hypothetical protein
LDEINTKLDSQFRNIHQRRLPNYEAQSSIEVKSFIPSKYRDDMGVMTLKEQRKETVKNYIEALDEMYEGLVFKPYWNQIFYPNGTIKKYHD